MKDNFSIQSSDYVRFRPTYPDELLDYILSLTRHHNTAWDCGAGSGQLTFKLANYFNQVFATDISAKQLEQAVQKPNITYKVESAEVSSFKAHSFDLITVAQAVHWFDFDLFYSEVRRTLKPDGLLAIIGYGLLEIEGQAGQKVLDFYAETLAGYWDKERRYIDERYQTIPFPFREIKAPGFTSRYEWNLEQLVGYLNTWSAVQHFIRQNGVNPVEAFAEDLRKIWDGNRTEVVTFPILLRLGHPN